MLIKKARAAPRFGQSNVTSLRFRISHPARIGPLRAFGRRNVSLESSVHSSGRETESAFTEQGLGWITRIVS